MNAVVLTAQNEVSVKTVSDPQPAEGEALVRIHAAALNHRDLWIKLGQYAGIRYPSIVGSDGAGVVEAVGSGVDASRVGGEVIINPSLDWGPNEHSQSDKFSILGLPRDGTLAELVAVPMTQLATKPAHLSWQEAAALPLAGLTAYRALFSRANIKPTERVLISGIGGGVAFFALQFAAAHGAEVWVTSSSEEKIKFAQEHGARGGFLYTRDGWARAAASEHPGFDVIVDSAGGEGFDALLDLAAPGARVVFCGATRGNPPVLPMRKVFWRQLSLLGTTMGSLSDWMAMASFVGRHQIKPVVSHTFPLERVAEAFDAMERGDQLGKIVVTFPSLPTS